MKSTPSFFIVRLPTHERHMQCTATRTCSTFFRPKPCIRGVTTLWHQSETRPQYRVPDTAVRPPPRALGVEQSGLYGGEEDFQAVVLLARTHSRASSRLRKTRIPVSPKVSPNISNIRARPNTTSLLTRMARREPGDNMDRWASLPNSTFVTWV